MYVNLSEEGFRAYWSERFEVELGAKLHAYYGLPVSIEVTKDFAHDFLSMQINRPLNVHEEGESFLDYTAKELAIRITFELEEKEGWNLFKGLQEPLSSRVFHYLTKLRSVD